MPRLDLDGIFANSNSKSFHALNANLIQAGRPQPTPAMRPELERGAETGPLATRPAQAFHPGKYFVRIISYRCVLLDEDNLCGKFLVDSLRYAALLPADSPDRCRIIATQEKVRTKKEERTEIQIDIIVD